MTSEKKETKKFLVPVTWVVAAEVVIEAESEEEAMELANNVDLDCFENADYVNGSFDVDFDMIEEWTEEDEKFWSGSDSKEIPAPADTQAAVEDYVFWREATEGVK